MVLTINLPPVDYILEKNNIAYVVGNFMRVMIELSKFPCKLFFDLLVRSYNKLTELSYFII